MTDLAGVDGIAYSYMSASAHQILKILVSTPLTIIPLMLGDKHTTFEDLMLRYRLGKYIMETFKKKNPVLTRAKKLVNPDWILKSSSMMPEMFLRNSLPPHTHTQSWPFPLENLAAIESLGCKHFNQTHFQCHFCHY